MHRTPPNLGTARAVPVQAPNAMVNYQHISLAPTNQSGCKGCGEKILQGQVRFGQTTTNR